MKIFITGGAGFIGCNLAHHHISAGDEVTVFDNLSRPGTSQNIDWLNKSPGNRLTFVRGDVRNVGEIASALPAQTDIVYHMAGQVAVTTSIQNPRGDFEANALGTLNLLEAVRSRTPEAVVFYASTNKVYGEMEDKAVIEKTTRYEYKDLPFGISEEQVLDFHSPYGCSKGAADQYVRDYARIYGLRTVVFRQSCIYGTRQFGVEDQGWLAHFCIAAKRKQPISIYGNGKQVRDILWIDDLIAAYDAAYKNIDECTGQVFNIGGGSGNTVSVWLEFRNYLGDLTGQQIEAVSGPWRHGDQKIYVSDIRKAQNMFQWRPAVNVKEGIAQLWQWISDNIHLLEELGS